MQGEDHLVSVDFVPTGFVTVPFPTNQHQTLTALGYAASCDFDVTPTDMNGECTLMIQVVVSDQ